MNLRRKDLLVVAVLAALLGIASGWYAASRSDGEMHDHGTEEPPEDDHGHPHFSDTALANMGVEYAQLAATTVDVEQSIVASIVDDPLNERPLQAPLGGVVERIDVVIGATVAAGAVVATIVRDPIPPPPLELTAEYVAPAHDEIHAAIRALTEAHADAAIAREELARVTQYTASGEQPAILPLQRRIDLEYALRRAEVAKSVSEHELERHGFSAEQIEALLADEHVPMFDAGHTRRALAHAGLWRGRADRLLAMLPERVAELPLAVASVAELAAKGLDSPELLALLDDAPAASEHFVPIASLLLAGTTVADLRRLLAAGAFEPTIEVAAPKSSPDWDVQAIAVRPGDRVAAGATLVMLRDPRELRLRIEPAGGEVEALVAAIEQGLACRALPLVPGSGPELSGLRVDLLTAGEGRPLAFARIVNREIEPRSRAESGPRFRSWALLPGLRYRLLVPVRELTDVFRLPRTAIAHDGAERILFVPTGDGGFDEVPVVVVHEDEQHVVVARGEGLRPGQRIVVRGAFELGLAMHASDSGAAHSHPH